MEAHAWGVHSLTNSILFDFVVFNHRNWSPYKSVPIAHGMDPTEVNGCERGVLQECRRGIAVDGTRRSLRADGWKGDGCDVGA